jgi:hypothetical protein
MAATNLKAADDAAESEAEPEPEQASDEGQPE